MVAEPTRYQRVRELFPGDLFENEPVADSVHKLSDDEELTESLIRDRRIAKEPATLTQLFLDQKEDIHKALHLSEADRLGIAAQVSGSNIKVSFVSRDPNDLQSSTKGYKRKDIKISNDNGRGVHVLFDIFTAVSKAAVKVNDIVCNLSWAGTHLGDVKDDTDKQGLWKHSHFEIERYKSNGVRDPINLGEFFANKLQAQGEERQLLVRNGLFKNFNRYGDQSPRKFTLKIFHDPHPSLLYGAQKANLKKGDNYAVLLCGTGTNIWIGEKWDPAKNCFKKYHQTRMGIKEDMFKTEDWKEFGRYLEKFRSDIYYQAVADAKTAGTYPRGAQAKARFRENFAKAELWFAGGNDEPHAGVKATFNYIRKLIRIVRGDLQDETILANTAKKRLDKIFTLLNLSDAKESIIKGYKSHPVLGRDLGTSGKWFEKVDFAHADSLVKAVMSNLVQRYTSVIGKVLTDHKKLIKKLKGFTIHGSFIHSLFDPKKHNLKAHFTKSLNSVLENEGKKFRKNNLQLDSAQLDGAYLLTLEDLVEQSA